MSLARWMLSAITLFLALSSGSADETHAPDPLFRSHEILDVRITAPLSTLISKRPTDQELPGTLQFTNSAGAVVEFDIKIRTRGLFRRDKAHCRFPPLRLNFVKSQTKGTLFHKQDKVKLVTHCQNSVTYREVVLREYIAYRILNVITDTSFRARLLRITYVDNERENKEAVRYGFVIEHKDRLSKRIGKPVLDLETTTARSLDPEYASTISMFHYLIGSTDFSSVKGVKNETCCHNHVLFGNEGEAIWSVPYDFDQAGLVNAPHAAPNPRFKIRDVKRRLYRGRCIHSGYVRATIARYQAKRADILQVVNELRPTSDKSIKPMVGYIRNFYKTLNSERKVNSVFINGCI